MPILKENKYLYPRNWKEISKETKERAGHRCQFCFTPAGQPNPVTSSIVVLTTAHLDHDPTNCDPTNLKALCQRCHNIYDGKHRIETRKKRQSTEMLEQLPSGYFLNRKICKGIKLLNKGENL